MASDEEERTAVLSENEGSTTGAISRRRHMPALRVRARQGTTWIMYDAIMGGQEAADGTWFEVYFHGAAPWEGKIQKGDFRLIVKGARLGLICQDIADALRVTLKVGVDTSGDDMPEVTFIAIEPLRVEMQDLQGY